MNTTTEPKTIIVGPGITVLDEPGEHSVKWFATPASASSVDIRQVSATTAHLVVLKGNEHWIGNYKGSVIAWFRIVTKSASPASWAWLAKPWGWIKSAASYAKPVLPFVLTAALAVGAFAVTQQQGCTLPDWIKPNPVNPVDPPKPPTPVVPIPSDGFRVAFILESADTLPKETHSIIYGGETRGYLNAKAKEWRIFDKDAVSSEPFWKAVLARPRASVPWVYVTTPTTFYEGPVNAETMAILKKHGG